MMNDQINNRLAELDRTLAVELARWRFPSHVSRDEVRVETLEALWQRERKDQSPLQKPIHWLRCTAKRKLLEISRRNQLERVSDEQLDKQLNGNRAEEGIATNAESAEYGLEKIRSWVSLAPERRFAITECVMFDRPVTDVSQELQVRRPTVSSWIRRALKRFAKDSEFQQLAAGR